MKKVFMMFMLLLAAIALTACSTQTGRTQENQAQEARRDAAAARSEVPVDEAAAETPQPPKVENDRPVDLDLTKISGTVVYSQVYDMMMQPEAYLGQKIRMKGTFAYFQDPGTHQEYFAAVIADATACCAQGIEFVWKGEHTYPQDYPPLDAEITVTGIFSTYYEGENMYFQLIDADVSWDGQ